MNRFVLDASVSAAWFLPDRNVKYAVRVRNRLAENDRALVPSLWSIEMANVLARAVRANAISVNDATRALGQLEFLFVSGPRIEVDPSITAVLVAYGMARKHQVSAYDGTYLQLALREELPLATLDNGLRMAALRAGVSILDEQFLS